MELKRHVARLSAGKGRQGNPLGLAARGDSNDETLLLEQSKRSVRTRTVLYILATPGG
jgi:hypothetical protein